MKKRRKRKVSSKKIIRLIIPIIFITLITIILINKDNIYTYYLIKTTGYNKDTISVIKDNEINPDILNKKYSKTLENIINTEYFNPSHINSYLDIAWQDNDNFLININNLLDLGYNVQDINTIYQSLTNESIDIITKNTYLKDLITIINLSYFKEDYLERYLKYLTTNELDSETAITYVNIGLDKDYYTNITNVDNQNDLLVLVNKYHKLASNYTPGDLKTIKAKYQWAGRSNALRKEASDAFEEMCEAASKDNIYIYAGSGYRSYSTQLYLYNSYVARDGKAEADTYSARAGHSEHQTGLSMDIANKSGFISEGDKEYTWLVKNSYKYGFILRYPKNKEKITGYMYEEWHYRYVGKDIAKEVYNSKLTYDEYIAKK